MKIEIDNDDRKEIESILKMTQITSDEVKIMESLIVKYLDSKCHICTHCPGQIRFAFNRLKMWYQRVG